MEHNNLNNAGRAKTVFEFINELNEAAKPLYNTKVNDFGVDIHSKVKELTSHLLPSYLRANTWRIEYINKEDDFDDILHMTEILAYNIDFKDDKRASHLRKGKLNAIWFKPTNENIDTHLFIHSYLDEIRSMLLRNKINAYEKYIIETREQAEKSIKSYETSISKLETQLRELLTNKIPK